MVVMYCHIPFLMEITRWRLRDRDYEIEIIVPITSVQPDNVKVAFGQKGRNLVETHVTCDDITEKTIKFQEIVRVSR